MDVFLYGLLAIVIAVAFSSVELLTKYHSRGIKEIFVSIHYLFFVCLNSLLCCAVYWFLPEIANIILDQTLSDRLDNGIHRSLVSGFGYLVIARTSFLDVKLKDDKTIGAGFDLIYNSVAQYILDHHARRMRKNMHEDFQFIYSEVSTDQKQRFKDAASLILVGLSKSDEKQIYKSRLDLAEKNWAETPEYCFAVYQLIRDHTTGKDEAANRIKVNQST